MTDAYGPPFAAPAAPGARARLVAGWAGRLSLPVVVAGLVAIVVTGGPRGTFWPGFAVTVGGIVLALGAIVHGRLREHERGRGFATVASILGLGVGLLLLWSHAKVATTRGVPVGAGVARITLAGH